MNTKSALSALVVALLFGASPSHADKREVWHGWAKLPPCTKTFTYRDSLGLSWPGMRTAAQEHHTRIYVDIPNESQLHGKLKQCAAGAAIAAGGAAAFLATPAAAWPAFKMSFSGCAAAEGARLSENLLTISAGSKCKW